MLSGAHVNFLQINLSECMHTIVTWICVVLLRLWPSGEPDKSCTRDVVTDACLWVVCVRSNLGWHLSCGGSETAQPTSSSHSRAQGCRLQIPLPSSSILPSISWEKVTAARTEVSVSFDPWWIKMMVVKMESCFLYHTRWKQNLEVLVPFSLEMFLPLYMNEQVKV